MADFSWPYHEVPNSTIGPRHGSQLNTLPVLSNVIEDNWKQKMHTCLSINHTYLHAYHRELLLGTIQQHIVHRIDNLDTCNKPCQNNKRLVVTLNLNKLLIK